MLNCFPCTFTNNLTPALIKPQDTVLTVQIKTIIQQAIEDALNASLWYRVQCVTVDEAAIMLSVYGDTIRVWIKQGKLPASKVGREWNIRLVDIEKMLNKNSTIILMDKRFKHKKVS